MELLLMVPLYLFYLFVRGVTEGRTSEAVSRAASIIKFEQAIGIFWEPRLQAGILDIGFVVNLMNWIYMWGFWPVILLSAIWMFFRHREAYHLYRNAFIISGAIGLLIFALFPVAPPRFMEAWGFVDTIAERSQAYRILQPPAFVNQYAAMPSLHFGWNLLVGIAMVRHGRFLALRALGVALPLMRFASILLTA
ncbi:MAG: phosphatase PAP2 family protein, partial [Chloroflexi bacterium]|nr:phosphatase PAP2 family protein [Chloroflexota bacterium]